MFSFFKKKTIQLPDDFINFPPYTGKIKKGPILKETPNAKRITYIVKGDIDAYRALLEQNAYVRKTDVRYDRGSLNEYVIIEKVWNGFKIAFHKKRVS